jgi:hypothetical protein
MHSRSLRSPRSRHRQLGSADAQTSSPTAQKAATFFLLLTFIISLIVAWSRWEGVHENYQALQSWLLASTGLSIYMIAALSIVGALVLALVWSHAISAVVFGNWKLLRFALIMAVTLLPGAWLLGKLNERVCFNRADEPLCHLVLTDEHEYRQWRMDGPLPPLGWKVMGTLTRADESLVGPAPQELPLTSCQNIAFFPSGVAAVYVSRRADGFHLWNRDGFDHATQARLQPVKQAEVPRICAQVDRRVREAEAVRRARAEEQRRRAEEAAVVRAAQEQAEKERKAREALDKANAPDFAAARLAAGGGNLVLARKHVDAIIAREPGNIEATQLADEWQLRRVCGDCGRVMAIGETTVKQAQSAYPALFAGAAGAAVGRNRGDESKRKESEQKGAMIGIALGSLIASANASRRVFIVSVQMDDGRVDHVPAFAKPQLTVGDRVVRSKVGEQVQLSRQTEVAPAKI